MSAQSTARKIPEATPTGTAKASAKPVVGAVTRRAIPIAPITAEP